jgi:hypothetical protein
MKFARRMIATVGHRGHRVLVRGGHRDAGPHATHTHKCYCDADVSSASE